MASVQPEFSQAAVMTFANQNVAWHVVIPLLGPGMGSEIFESWEFLLHDG